MPDQLEQLKLARLDPLLSGIITKRVIFHLRINEPSVYKPLLKELEPVVRELINPPLLDIIRSDGVDSGGDGGGSDGYNYKKEDEVTFSIRKLVEFQHGVQNRKLVRKITRRCMDAIEAIADSDEFNDRLDDAKRKSVPTKPPRPKKR